MIVGTRIDELLRRNGMSQSELARRVKLNQSTINGLVAGEQRSSTKLHQIARELGTTPAYLTGETDDPTEGATQSPAGPHVIMLGVVLPPKRALARMFEGLLEQLDRDDPVGTQAQQLAEQLPIAMSQLGDLLPDEVTPVRELAVAAAGSPTRGRGARR